MSYIFAIILKIKMIKIHNKFQLTDILKEWQYINILNIYIWQYARQTNTFPALL